MTPANIHPNKFHANIWRYLDFEGAGKLDLVIGVGGGTNYGDPGPQYTIALHSGLLRSGDNALPPNLCVDHWNEDQRRRLRWRKSTGRVVWQSACVTSQRPQS